MRPEALAAAHAAALAHLPGRGPVTLEPVALGEVNETYQAARDGRAYALRLARTGRPDPGIDRDWECRVLGSAAAHGLAPPVVACDPARGMLVLEWQTGAPGSSLDARTPENIRRLAELVRRVQALRVPGAPRCRRPRDWVEHYEARLARAPRVAPQTAQVLAALAAERSRRLAALEALAPCSPRLCHGDLHRENLIEAHGRWLLLDWEYAHLADPLWDLAAWVSSNEFSPEEAQALLHAWRAAAPGTDVLDDAAGSLREACRRLELLRWLYEYICLLWALFVEPAPADLRTGATSIQARLERLRSAPP